VNAAKARMAMRSANVAPANTVAAAAPKQVAQVPADPVRMITYNTAIGNSKIKTDQRDFLKLPFYQDVLHGRPNAPILTLQEVGQKQLEALQAEEKRGNFSLMYIAKPYGGQGPQYNVVVVPKRYEIVEGDSHYFRDSHLGGAVKHLWSWASSGFKTKLNPTQLVEPRMFNQLRLKDTQSGRQFTVINTHLSLLPEIRKAQARELAERLDAAKKYGPVVLTGDLNTYAPGTGPKKGANADADREVHKILWSRLTDMGADQKKLDKPNIDFILANGFKSKSTKIYDGDSISLPGSPTAKEVSDHYAEEDVLEFI
jgi:endonuclease/exonuclease/phosphatase family metal-dependent hydrolase